MDHTNEIGSNWKEIRKEIFTQEEIYKSDERVASISKIIEEKMKEYSKFSKIKMDELDLVLWYKEAGEIFK